MTECGDNVGSPNDVCHSTMTGLCARVVDEEFPVALESDEAGDRDIGIVVRELFRFLKDRM